MERFLEWVTGRPKTILAALLIVTAVFSSQLPKLRIEAGGRTLIPEDHPSVLYDNEVQEIFGLRETILVVITNETEERGILNPHSLSLLDDLTQKIKKIDGVVSREVMSIATEKKINVEGDRLDLVPLMAQIPTTPEEMDRLERNLEETDLYTGTLISRDKKAASIYVELEKGADREKVYSQIQQRVKEHRQDACGTEEIFVAGAPVAEAMLGQYILQDLRVMMPAVSLIMALVLFLTYFSIRGILLPLIKVAATILWTLGLMAALDIPITLVTSIMPVILMAMGIADEIHIFGRYHEELSSHPSKTKRQIVITSLFSIWKPVLYTSLTTSVAFLSFLFSPIEPLRHFGLFTAFGILTALLFSLTYIPACLVLLKPFRPKGDAIGKHSFSRPASGRLERTLFKIGTFLFQYRKGILFLSLLILPASFIGISRIYVQDSWIDNFSKKSDIYLADAKINQKFYGTHILNIIVEGAEEGALYSPLLLHKIEKLQNILGAMEDVGGSISIVDYLKTINQKLHNNQKDYYKIPTSEEEVAQSLFLFSMSGETERLKEMVDEEYRQASIKTFLNQANFIKTARVIQTVTQYSRDHLAGENAKIHLAGDLHVSQSMVGLVVSSQISSLLISMVGIFLMTALMFRSWTAGFFNIFPVILAILLNFGVMGILDIPLGVATSMISSLIFGIGVDYAIHFNARYKGFIQKDASVRDATLLTLRTTGKSILFNAGVIMAGFLTLLLSQMPPNQRFGGLVSLAMFTSFLATMTALPALLSLMKPKFIFKPK